MLNVVFDASVVTNIFYKDWARSGIFFAAKNMLDEMLKRKDVKVTLYFSSECYADGARLVRENYPGTDTLQEMSRFLFLQILCRKLRFFYSRFYDHRYFRKIFALLMEFINSVFRKTVLIDGERIRRNDVFFSPVFVVPDFVRRVPEINTFVFLYDFIQLRFPQYYPEGVPLVKRIIESSNSKDRFFFDSLSAKNDGKHFFSTITDENSMVVHLAANKNFKRILDNQILDWVKKKYKIPSKKKYLFSLCTVEPRKNLIRAVRCFLEFISKHNISDLVWVMGGGHWDYFINELKKNNVRWDSNFIIQAGYIDDEDLPVLYSNAEWFVYTSQYEGFGLPPLEAMQCGCPVITSNNSSLPEVVGDAGMMIDWDSDDQHIEAYEKYYFDENLRKEFSKKGLERAKLFSWEKTVDVIVGMMKTRV